MRPLLTTSRDAKKQMKRDRSTKVAIDALEEKVKNHDEKNILRTEKQRFDAMMGLQSFRNSLDTAGLYNRLTNLDLARSALHLPASLAGMNLIRGMHVPMPSPAPAPPPEEKGPEVFDIGGSDPEMSAVSSTEMTPRTKTAFLVGKTQHNTEKKRAKQWKAGQTKKGTARSSTG